MSCGCAPDGPKWTAQSVGFGLPSSLGSPGRAKKPGGVLGTVTQDSSSGQYAAAYFFLQQGCTLNGPRIIATVNVASYQLLEGLITHPELCCQPRDGGTQARQKHELALSLRSVEVQGTFNLIGLSLKTKKD